MLTDQEIVQIALATKSAEPGRDGYILPFTFARAVEQAATAPLLARIAELEAELEKTKAIFATSCNHAAVMELERDAKRYHLLRSKVCIVGDSFHVINIKPTYIAPDAAIELDSAIDAAIAKATEREGA